MAVPRPGADHPRPLPGLPGGRFPPALLFDRTGDQFVGLANYLWAFSDREFRKSVFNNILWLVVVPAACTFFGLVIAFLTDRIWWGNIAKTLIFMPMAISFVGASVIWKFIYDYRSEGSTQIGLLNAIVQGLGGAAAGLDHAALLEQFLPDGDPDLDPDRLRHGHPVGGAARHPEETIEAAVIDGANGWQLFFYIMIPQIWGTIAVVWTTITILVLKVFDIVLTMTNGQWNTQVLANLMFDWMFRGGGDFGRGAAIAVVIMLAVIPIMIWNIRRANAEMEGAEMAAGHWKILRRPLRRPCRRARLRRRLDDADARPPVSARSATRTSSSRPAGGARSRAPRRPKPGGCPAPSAQVEEDGNFVLAANLRRRPGPQRQRLRRQVGQPDAICRPATVADLGDGVTFRSMPTAPS